MREKERSPATITVITALLFVVFFGFPQYSRGQQPITLASSLHNPFALTVDQNNVYWIETFISVNGTTFMIRKMPLNGGTSVDIATQSFGFIGIAGMPSIAVDNTAVYWSFSPGFGIGFLYKAPITGGTPTFLTGANQPSDIALDSNFIYWAEDNGGPDVTQGIRKVSLNGGDVTMVTTLGIPLALTVVGSEVYFSYFDFFSGGNRIGRVSAGGGVVTELVSTVSRASDMVADATHLYWAEFDAGTVNKIPLGGGIATNLANGLNQPWRLAIDVSNVYWAEFAGGADGAGAVKSVSLAGGATTTLASGLNGPFAIAADGTAIYWSELGTNGTDGAIKKIGKVVSTSAPPPVILVHGFLGNPGSFGSMKSLLVSDAGYKAEDVYEYDYKFLTDCDSASNTTIELIAADFARFLKARLNMYPPGTQVDVITHSMGGLVVRAYMVGMAPAPNGSPLPYGNEIRRLIIAGTPNYGAEDARWNNILRVVCGVNPGGSASQAQEMKFGARFLWDLDHKWLGKAPVDPSNLLAIAGTAGGLSDGIVRIASAALPEDFFLPVGHILYVPYRHCDFFIKAGGIRIYSVCGDRQDTSLVNIQDTSHLTYRTIKEFLRSGHPPTQASLGYQPSNQVLDDSLLLLRMVDKVTQAPIVPPPSITLNCLLNVVPSPTIIPNRDSDAGTVTVVGIPASFWACSVEVEISRYYFGASINDITMIPSLPYVRAIELALRPDRTR